MIVFRMTTLAPLGGRSLLLYLGRGEDSLTNITWGLGSQMQGNVPCFLRQGTHTLPFLL